MLPLSFLDFSEVLLELTTLSDFDDLLSDCFRDLEIDGDDFDLSFEEFSLLESCFELVVLGGVGELTDFFF